MGIWEFVYSGTDAVKRNVPGLNTVQNACNTTYCYGAAAVTKIDKVIRIGGLQTINSCMPDEKSRSQIGLFASKFVQNMGHYAVKEGFKMLPGGKAFSDIVDKTIDDVNLANRSSFQGNGESERCSTKSDMIEVMEEIPGKGIEIISGKQLIPYPNEHGKPEDVLRVFMMKEFIGSHILDDLLIPQSRRGNGTTNSDFVP